MRGGTKMKFSVTFRTDYDIKQLCEKLASECHYSCPVGKLPCPFISLASKIKTRCADITKDDWDAALRDY